MGIVWLVCMSVGVLSLQRVGLSLGEIAVVLLLVHFLFFVVAVGSALSEKEDNRE
jgi:hypothetical protein